MKTVKDWLLELPQELSGRAIYYSRAEGTLDAPSLRDNLGDVLSGAFNWSETEEKNAFWSDVAVNNGWDAMKVKKETHSTAKLIFQTIKQAENFCKEWSRKTLKGHTIGAGSEKVEVSVYEVNDAEKSWIDKYVSENNKYDWSLVQNVEISNDGEVEDSYISYAEYNGVEMTDEQREELQHQGFPIDPWS